MKITKEDLVIGAIFDGLNYGDAINAVQRTIELTYPHLPVGWRGIFTRPLPPYVGHKIQGSRYSTPQAITDLLNPWTRGYWNGKPDTSTVDNYGLELAQPTPVDSGEKDTEENILAFFLKGRVRFQGQESSVLRFFSLHPHQNPNNLVINFFDPALSTLIPDVSEGDLEKVGQKLARQFASEQDTVLRSMRKAKKLNWSRVHFPLPGGLPGTGQRY